MMNTRQQQSPGSPPAAATACSRLSPTGRSSVLFRSFVTVAALWAVTAGVSRSTIPVNGSSSSGSAPPADRPLLMAGSPSFSPHLWDRTLKVDASRAAAPLVEKMVRAYRQKHPQMRVTVRVTPEQAGFERLVNLSTQVVFTSRRMDENERLRAWLMSISLTEKPLSADAGSPSDIYVYARTATLKGRPLVAEFVRQATQR